VLPSWRWELTVGDGSSRILGPGELLLADDIVGEGHSSREHFDTAESYGGGRSEEILGAALTAHRGQVVTSTKFGSPSTPSLGGPADGATSSGPGRRPSAASGLGWLRWTNSTSMSGFPAPRPLTREFVECRRRLDP
jgi:hypothetical protein